MDEHNYTQEKQIGNWIVYISPDTNYGYFENQITGDTGGLWFRGKMVVGYDGVYCLPASVIKALKSLHKTFDKFIIV